MWQVNRKYRQNVTRLTGIKAFFPFFFAQSHRLRTVSALETPISNHIHFPSPQLNGFSFQATVIHSPVYIYVAVILLTTKEREIRQMHKRLTLARRYIWRLVHPIYVVKKNLFFLANTIATEEKNPPNKLPSSLSGRSQILANSGSSVKKSQLQKSFILR